MTHPRRSSIVPSCPNRGFTLIEMLVVIAIIAILAGVVFGAGSVAINAAKRAKAGVIASGIQTAILNYYTEYGVYPVPSTAAAGDVELSTSAGEADLMVALCGNINASSPAAPVATATVANTRQIAYLTPKKSDVDTSGVLINPFSTSANPTYFTIAMDADYSGILGDSGTGVLIPDFSTWTTGNTMPGAGVTLTQGAAIWACCDTRAATPALSKAPNFWVHTY